MNELHPGVFATPRLIAVALLQMSSTIASDSVQLLAASVGWVLFAAVMVVFLVPAGGWSAAFDEAGEHLLGQFR